MNTTNNERFADDWVHCSPSGDWIWNNRNISYYHNIAQKRIHA